MAVYTKENPRHLAKSTAGLIHVEIDPQGPEAMAPPWSFNEC